ncbi:MAG: hypothetical protein F8N37_06350 [Telmatospirillum sp.]|nr:hypothetical protein [Telmatospirillum sp.]
MTGSLPTGRSGQVIAVLLAILSVVAVWRLLVSPIVEIYGDRQTELERRALLASHLEALARQLPALEADPALAGPPLSPTIDGPTDAVAAATLQGMVQTMVVSAGGNLGSVEILPAEPVGGLRRIGLRVTLAGTDDLITGLLDQMSRSHPPILVDDLQLHGNLLPVPGAPAAERPVGALRLDASFAVYAFRADRPEVRP